VAIFQALGKLAVDSNIGEVKSLASSNATRCVSIARPIRRRCETLPAFFNAVFTASKIRCSPWSRPRRGSLPWNRNSNKCFRLDLGHAGDLTQCGRGISLLAKQLRGCFQHRLAGFSDFVASACRRRAFPCRPSGGMQEPVYATVKNPSLAHF